MSQSPMKHSTSIAALFAFGSIPCALAQVKLSEVVNVDPGRFFYRTSRIGDVNGDGVPDLSVSGTGYGAVYSGANAAKLHDLSTLGGGGSGLVIGTLDRVGDLDGDFCDDFAFGAPDQAPGGHVRVYSGKTGVLLHDLVGDAPPSSGINFLGYEVVGLGDVDGDGTPDFGASRFSFVAAEPAAIFAYSGVTGAAIFSNFDASGASAPNIAYASDVNADGRDDVLVAYTRSPETDSCDSVVELRSGNGGGLLRSFADPLTCGEGTGLLGGADFDGDAVPDVIVGSVYGVWDTAFATGNVTGYSGASGALLFRREGFGDEGSLGASMAICGDVNADGFLELACGQPDGSMPTGVDAGSIHVFSMGSRARFETTFAGPGPFHRLGTSLCAPGDLNVDGLDELAATTPGPYSVTEAKGSLAVFSLSGLAAGADHFVPGSSLRGTIGASDVDDAEFDALDGMKLKLQFTVAGGGLKPRVRIESQDGEHSVSWSPKPQGTSKKTIKLKRDGRYTMTVEGKAGSTGDYHIATGWKVGKSVPQFVNQQVNGKNGNPPKVKFRALAGTLVVGSVESNAGSTTQPALELRGPLGAVTDLALFSAAFDRVDAETEIDGVLISNSGQHEVAIVPGPTAPTAAHFVFDIVTPRGREILDFD
jgi:hypothetical protein